MTFWSGASAFHGIIFLVYLVTLSYDWIYVDIGHQGYGGKFKYLTFWNLCLQTAYFGLCFANNITNKSENAKNSTKPPSLLQKFRDNFHATIVFPVGMFVVVTFWAIYAVDRELVFPKALDSLIPTWMNHLLFVQVIFWALFFYNRNLIFPESRAALVPRWLTHLTHTTVLPFLLVDKVLVYHHHPERHIGILILTIFASTYLAWILWIAHAADIWVYPVLQIMSDHERVIFISFLLMFFISIYLVGESLTKFLWRKERPRSYVKAEKVK